MFRRSSVMLCRNTERGRRDPYSFCRNVGRGRRNFERDWKEQIRSATHLHI
jgi:hypothetical protein